jgi:hypothetical protein
MLEKRKNGQEAPEQERAGGKRGQEASEQESAAGKRGEETLRQESAGGKREEEALRQEQASLQEHEAYKAAERKKEAELQIETYQTYYEKFEGNRERLGYTPLQYIVRIFEAYGVNSTLEIFKAYLGYLQTLTGLKGTNVIAIGSQSSGKSHIIENPLDCIPDEFVHKGTFTKASFFTEFAGRDLTHHIFYHIPYKSKFR